MNYNLPVMEFRWLWLVFFTHVGLCSRPSNDRQVSLQSTGDRVQVTLLYEALCPFCQLFFRNQLVPLMRSGLEKYIQLELVPYGNGHVSNHTVQCQHGPSECQLNTAHLCAMRVLKDNKKSFDAIACMETNQQPDKTMVNDWTDCLEASDRTKIVGCMKSQGTALLKAAAMRTDAFSHRYGGVPKEQ